MQRAIHRPRYMDQLPVDVLANILLRLPIKPLMICRCVSKVFLNLTCDPGFAQAHLSRSAASLSSPNLLLKGGYNDGIYFLEQNQQALDDDNRYTLTELQFVIPGSSDCFRVFGSCHGLLCLASYVGSNRLLRYICNPFTGQHVRLPNPISPLQHHERELRFGRDYRNFGFGFCDKTHEYKVVEIVCSEPCDAVRAKCSKVFVFTVGDECWREKGDVPYAVRTGGWAQSQNVFLNDALHWVCSSLANSILSFDVGDEAFRVIPCPKFRHKRGHHSVGVLGGRLSITDKPFISSVEIWVMQEYGVKESWTKCFAIMEIGEVHRALRTSETLCFQGDGKLLFFGNSTLLLYDPHTTRTKVLKISGLPSWFDTVTHVASLVSPPGCIPRPIELRNADGNSIACQAVEEGMLNEDARKSKGKSRMSWIFRRNSTRQERSSFCCWFPKKKSALVRS